MNTTSPDDDDRNGTVVIRFSADELEAWADFTPPQEGGKAIANDYLLGTLERLNVIQGVRWEAIKNAVRQCNLERKVIKNVLIAVGIRPVKETNEYFEINRHLVEQKAPVPDKKRNDQIDYRSHSPFIIVHKDQVLAIKKPRIPGREGKNVRGGSIPFGTIVVDGLSPGENTRSDEKYIISEINGQLVEEKKALHVRKDLTIKGSVGYATGNIIFPGDVFINGAVSDGFKIYSGGSVTIKQTFDVTEVITKGDLNVSGGIVGRGRAFLKVGGFLRTKFIQNCKAACRRTITVDAGIVNSHIFAMENLDMGDKGQILGGEIYAIKGIRAGSIGKNAGKATRIHCGIDFTRQKEQEVNNKTLLALSEKLAKLRAIMAAPHPDPEKEAKLQEALRILEGQQKTASARGAELLTLINANEDAAVEVNGEIAAGTLIVICETALFVAEPLRHIRVRLDKTNRKLITEPL
ncbi:MAG: FapA family protein [Treponema sp.]|nr:FapA family protein [Treponema sp.]